MNPAAIFKLMKAKEEFNANHPKFGRFLKAAYQKALKENSIIEVTITTPEGESMSTNLKVKESDLELLKEIMKG